MTAGLNPYDFERDCYHSDLQASAVKQANYNPWRVTRGDYKHLRKLIPLPRVPHPVVEAHYHAKAAGSPGKANGNAPCIDSDGATTWLNREDVKKALHVTESTVPSWTICSDIVSNDRVGLDVRASAKHGGVLVQLEYGSDGVYHGMSPLYKEMSEGGYRIVVYNGDTDPGCNYLGDELCVQQLGNPVKDEWRQWHYDDSSVTSQGSQVGGWTVEYDVNGELRFITVKGAGHMAPQWRPAATTTMFQRFIDDEPF
eukprot:scaffold212_cov404-Prasinococcus_capsulatus_cf.AAC.3